MANYVENFASKLDWAMPFQRTGAFPLDRTNLFSSYEDAVKYALGTGEDSRKLGGTSYVGQIITVFENDSVIAYLIGSSRELIRLAATSASGDLQQDVLTLQSKVSKLEVAVGNPTEGEEGKEGYKAASGLYALIEALEIAYKTADEKLLEDIEKQLGELSEANETLATDLETLEGRVEATEERLTSVENKATTAFHFKGNADAYAGGNIFINDVAVEGMVQGDIYFIGDKEYAYDGEKWVEVGYATDLSAYSTTEQINKAIKDKIEDLDVAALQVDQGETLKVISETDGKIAVEKQAIAITASQVTDFGTEVAKVKVEEAGVADKANALKGSLTVGTKVFDGSESVELVAADIDTYNKQEIEAELNKKVNNSDFESFKTTNSEAIGLKANTTDVNNQISAINDSLSKKAEAEKVVANTTFESFKEANTKAIADATSDKVVGNVAITGGTHTKITYDSKGLVTGGEDLTASDIPELPIDKIKDLSTTYATKTEVSNIFGTDEDTSASVTVKGARALATEALNAANAGASNVKGIQKNGVQLTPNAEGNVNLIIPTGALADKSEVAEADLASDLKTKINGKLDASAVTGDLLTHNASEFATASQGAKADTAVQTVTTGVNNGTIKVDGEEIAVAGLGSAAYVDADSFDSQGTAQALVEALDATHTATSGKYISGITQVDGKITEIAETALPEAVVYSIEKASESGDYAAVYYLTADGEKVGTEINIPKDMVVESGAVVTNPEGQEAGTYIELKLQNVEEPLYINVGNLIEYVTGGTATDGIITVSVDSNHVATATINNGTITLNKLATEVQEKIGQAHTHGNKALLDTYTQTEANLADAVAKKHSHDENMKEITSVGGELELVNGALSYNHPTTEAKEATFCKVGNDGKGHVVVGEAIVKGDLTQLLDAGEGTYDSKGTAQAIKQEIEAMLTWGSF